MLQHSGIAGQWKAGEEDIDRMMLMFRSDPVADDVFDF